MSDRLDLLKPLLTAGIKKMALLRITDSQKLFRGEKLIVCMPEADVKIVLLLAEIINPHEDFSTEERALMSGVCSKTLRNRKQQEQLTKNNKR